MRRKDVKLLLKKLEGELWKRGERDTLGKVAGLIEVIVVAVVTGVVYWVLLRPENLTSGEHLIGLGLSVCAGIALYYGVSQALHLLGRGEKLSQLPKYLYHKGWELFYGLKAVSKTIDPCEFDLFLEEINKSKILNALKDLAKWKSSSDKAQLYPIEKNLEREYINPATIEKSKVFKSLIALNNELLRKLMEKSDRLLKRSKILDKIYRAHPKLIGVRAKDGPTVYKRRIKKADGVIEPSGVGGEGAYSDKVPSMRELKVILGLLERKGYLKKTVRRITQTGYKLTSSKLIVYTQPNLPYIEIEYALTPLAANALAEKFIDDILDELGDRRTNVYDEVVSDEQRDYELGDSYDLIDIKSVLDAGAKDPTFTAIKSEDLKVWKLKSRGYKGAAVVVLVDTSGSMRGEHLEAAKRAVYDLKQIIERGGGKLWVIGFSDKAYESNLEEILASSALGWTNIQDALESSGNILKEEFKDGKEVILISDCCPTTFNYYVPPRGVPKNVIKFLNELEEARPFYESALKEAIELRKNGVKLNTVGINTQRDPLGTKFGETLAAIGGGRFYQVSPEDLGRVLITDYAETLSTSHS